jgi:tRNA(Ile)-lysidine synthase TilS/MesJ
MTCKQCIIKPVWKFTNQNRLCKSCFIDYIEKKVFKTIRKFEMLGNGGREIRLKKEKTLNYNVLKNVLEKKFLVKNGNDFSSENLSQIAEKTFENILNGKYIKISANNPNKPLYFISDAELELYAKLKNISGKPRIKNKRIQELFQTFLKKNQDLEINIVKAMEQLH